MHGMCLKKEVKKARFNLELFAGIILFILDLIFKYLAVSGNHAVINVGVSFGVLIGSEAIHIVLISILLYWLARYRMWLIFAGGAANMVSRVVWGGVVDYWNFLGIFNNNLADWAIALGVIFYAIQYTHGNTNNF